MCAYGPVYVRGRQWNLAADVQVMIFDSFDASLQQEHGGWAAEPPIYSSGSSPALYLFPHRISHMNNSDARLSKWVDDYVLGKIKPQGQHAVKPVIETPEQQETEENGRQGNVDL